MTIVGTRPEIIRLSRVIPLFDATLDHVFVHTGQNHAHELNGLFFDELGLRAPDVRLDVARDTPAGAIAAVIDGTDRAMAKHAPDAVLILGDTNSALAALTAKRRRIPIFHMEAGNRAFDARIPEETNRRIVDHLADINLCYTRHARENLLREGLPPDQIVVTGSPMREVLEHYAHDAARATPLARLELQPGGYFVVSAHREENVDPPERLAQLVAVLRAVADTHGLPIVLSTHPRTARRLAGSGLDLPALVQAHPPFGFHDWIRLQSDARAVLSDSGTLTEEAAVLGFPAVALRDAHERPEGVEHGTTIIAGLSPARVLDALAVLNRQPPPPPTTLPNDYAPANVSEVILRTIVGYTDFVRRRVWHAHH